MAPADGSRVRINASRSSVFSRVAEVWPSSGVPWATSSRARAMASIVIVEEKTSPFFTFSAARVRRPMTISLPPEKLSDGVSIPLKFTAGHRLYKSGFSTPGKGTGLVPTRPSTGDQLQPWRKVKCAHQQIHQGHAAEARAGGAKHDHPATFMTGIQRGQDGEGRRRRVAQRLGQS